MADSNFSGSNENVIQARSFNRVTAVLVAIERLDKPCLSDLIQQTGIPERSVHAMLSRVQREYRVVIERVDGRRFGYYSILDWGVLNRERILSESEGDEPEPVDDSQAEIDFQPI